MEDLVKCFFEDYLYELLDNFVFFLVYLYGEEIYKDDVKYVIFCK